MSEPTLLHKPFDVTSKELIEHHPRDLLEMFRFEGVHEVAVTDADLSTIVAAADKVLKINASTKPYLAHIEFQTGLDPDLDERSFGYNTLLQYRHRLPVQTVLVLLTRFADQKKFTGLLEIKLPNGKPVHTFHYDVVRLWQMPVEQVLGGGIGLLPLAPLCDDAVPCIESVIGKMGQRLTKISEQERIFLWSATYFFMGLRYPIDVIKQVLRGGKAMKESVTYQLTLEEGRKEGRGEGLQGLRRMLLEIGKEMLGTPSRKIQQTIEAIDDLRQLEGLGKRLPHVKTWQDLLASETKPSRRKKSSE